MARFNHTTLHSGSLACSSGKAIRTSRTSRIGRAIRAIDRLRAFSAGLLLLLCATGLVPAGAHAAEGVRDVQPLAAQPQERTEYWSGKILSATFRATMCSRPDGALRGVFLLTHKNGDTDVYHVLGHIEGNAFEARHRSGHVISGDLGNPGEVSGRMRLKNGMSFKFKSPRHYNVPVTDDCAPLDGAD